MPKPFSVQCPNCEARLKIQNPKAIGKKVRCPNCEEPFTVNAPRPAKAAARDDFDLDDDYDDYGSGGGGFDDFGDDYEDDYDDYGPPKRSTRMPAPARAARKGGGKSSKRGKKPSRKRKKSNNNLPLIAGGIAIGLLVVAAMGFLIYQLAGGGGTSVNYAWLPPESQMVVSIDVDDMWNSNVFQRSMKGPQGEELKKQMDQMESQLKKIGFNEGESIDAIDSVTIGFEDPDRPDRGKMIVVVRKKSAWNLDAIKQEANLEDVEHAGKTIHTGGKMAMFLPDDSTLVLGSLDSVKDAIDRGPDSKISEKFDFLPKGHIVVGVMPDNADELSREMRPPPAAGLLMGQKEYIREITEAMKDIRGGAMGFTFGSGVEMEFLGKFSNSDSAGKVAGGIDDALSDIRSEINKNRDKLDQAPPQMKDAIELAESVFDTVSASRSGESVVISLEVTSSVIDKAEKMAKEAGGGPGAMPMPKIPNFDLGDLLGGLGGGNDAPVRGGNPFADAREAARRAADKNNLKQIGIALHNYHDVHNSLPVAPGRDGKPNTGLSWRVHLLPFVEQAPLYNQFKMDEPWNSPHNMRLVNQMPNVYKRPGSNTLPGKTSYVGIDGPGGILEGGRGTKFRDVSDGMSNTIMVTEVEDHAAVIWTKPEDYTYNRSNPTRNLANVWTGGFHALLGDGSVRFISSSINPQTLLNLFQMNDGNPTGQF